jgi:ABC-2 type transport system ATP-binding protein
MLGPNGAGKTTTMRMLSTPLSLTSGRRRSPDACARSAAVRRTIGFALQEAGLAKYSTGRDTRCPWVARRGPAAGEPGPRG